MDPGTDPTDADDIIQRYGRRLFVLAYNLTGDGGQADDLAQECLVRSFLAPDLPAGDRETVVFLIRGLISLWKERLDLPARPGASRGRVTVPAAPSRPAGEHATLWQALSRLDPTSRAVLVLRVAGDLEYETVGRVLDMAADVVYARLLQARSRLRQGETVVDRPLFETMNLYLDGRLPGDQRGEFERRLRSDPPLRERVEFHRGLTLELHEEAPPLPRDFGRRIHDRLDRTRETLALVDQAAQAAGWEPAAGSPPRASGARLPPWRSVAAVAALVVVVAAITFWIARRAPATAPAPSSPGASQPGRSAGQPAAPDEATIEALRSLGYLAPARDRPAPGSAAAPSGREAGPRRTPAGPAVSPAPAEKEAAARPSPAPARSPPPEAAANPAQAEPAPAPPKAQPAPGPATVPWSVVPVGRVPELGRDHQVIRTAPEWGALFEGTGAEVPDVAFDREMVVLLRHDLGSDPPALIAVVSVAQTAEALWVECRREPSPAGAEGTGAPAAGQAIVLPISDLPVRMVIK
jgi:DNA-directed RNA polymerase specialized sigma24 family protein